MARAARHAECSIRQVLQAEEARFESGGAALVELSRRVGSMEWGRAISCIVEFDAAALGVERVSSWSLGEDGASICCDVGYVAKLRSFEHGGTLLERDLPDYFRAMHRERVIVMDDVQTDPRCRGLRDYCSARGISSMLDVPLWSEGQLCGVLCHEHVGVAARHWTDRELNFVAGVSQIVSLARAARVHTQAEAAVRRAAFLDTVSRELSVLDVQLVARRAVALCVPKLADCATLWVKSREGALECIAHDAPQPVLDRIRVHGDAWKRRNPTMTGFTFQQGQSLLVPEITPSVLERYHVGVCERAEMQSLGFSTAMTVPLAVAGKVVGAMGFFAIGRHFDAEDLELAERTAERVASALENARLYEVAREAIRARDELVVVAAHELRTPLTALLLDMAQMVRLARRNPGSAEAERSDRIAGHVRRFCAQVDHIMDALRIRAEGITVRRRPLDLAALVQERVESIRPRAQSAGSTVEIEGPPSLTAAVDRASIQKAIDALLDNAIKFGSGKPITVSLRTDDAGAEVSVRDHGMGIAPERQSAIFQPFGRACSTEHFGGFGLGLYITKAIVEAHGGSIATTTSPGGGATFLVRLPHSRPESHMRLC